MNSVQKIYLLNLWWSNKSGRKDFFCHVPFRLNIIYPAKQKIIPLLDTVCEAARVIGAINTVVFRDGKRFGYNIAHQAAEVTPCR